MKLRLNFSKFFVLVFFIAFVGCKDDNGEITYPATFNFDFEFENDLEGWTALFADYPAGREEDMGLSYAHTNLPDNLSQDNMAAEISGTNISDDLLMMMKKKITGLRPNTSYSISFDIDVASKYPENSFGIGGSPGSSVVMKVGAVQEEPTTEVDDLDHERPTWDNLTALAEGERTDDVVVIGNIGIEGEEEVYEIINLNNESTSLQFSKSSDSEGNLWLMVGTDSGFEGPTTLYYDAIHIVLNEMIDN